MTTCDMHQHRDSRKRRARVSALSIAAAGTMICGVLCAPPALAADTTVTTSAELIQVIEDANAAQGIDSITIDGEIVLEADLPAITDDLVIQGRNGAAIDGQAGTHQGITAEDIALLSIEGVELTALRGSAIHASNIEELVVFSVEINQPTGHGVYIYANGTRAEIRDVEVHESRYDGVRARLFHGASAEIHGVTVTDSGRVEATQPEREQGGLSVKAMHKARATLSEIHYLETGDTRDRGDERWSFSGIVVHSTDSANVNVSGASVEGPIDIAVQLTAGDSSAINAEALSVDGVPSRTEHAVDIHGSETAQLAVSDSQFVNTGSLLALLSDDSQVHVSHSTFDRSGTEAALGAVGADAEANGRFVAQELMIENAPWTGLWVEGVADAEVTSSTLAHNGAGEPGPALVLEDNGITRVTNSTVSDNNGEGISIRSAEAPQIVEMRSTTIADNSSDSLEVLLKNPGDTTPRVDVRNTIVSGAAELELEGELESSTHDYSGVTSAYSLWNGVSEDFAANIDTTGVGNIVNVDPALEALAQNGGVTLTRLPAAESPAIDAGDPDPIDAPLFDQRGVSRIDGIIDMGSVEAGTLEVIEPGEGEPGEGEPGEGEPGEGEPGEGEPGEGEPGEGEPGEGEPGEGEPGEAELPVAGEPDAGKLGTSEQPKEGKQPAAGDDTLPLTGATAAAFLTLSGIAVSAGAVLLGLARLRRQSA